MKRRERREVEGNGRKRKGIPPTSPVSLFFSPLEHGEGGGGERARAAGGVREFDERGDFLWHAPLPGVKLRRGSNNTQGEHRALSRAL